MGNVFLLAEASLYGWNTGITAKEAYENGIKASFEYFGVSEYVNDYLSLLITLQLVYSLRGLHSPDWNDIAYAVDKIPISVRLSKN